MRDALGRPVRVALFGGTSEIGLAIVRRLAGQDRPDLVFAGRPSPLLDATAAKLRQDGHDVRVVPFDAHELESIPDVIEQVWADGDVDVIVVAFGVLGDQDEALSVISSAVEMGTVNYLAAVAVGTGVYQQLRSQGHGAIVALSSVAGERARRANFVYGSTKAGFDAFYSGLADHVADSAISVTVVRPGFVRTRMTADRPAAPFATSPDHVASVAVEALHRGAPVAWAPRRLRFLMMVLRVIPRRAWRQIRS